MNQINKFLMSYFVILTIANCLPTDTRYYSFDEHSWTKYGSPPSAIDSATNYTYWKVILNNFIFSKMSEYLHIELLFPFVDFFFDFFFSIYFLLKNSPHIIHLTALINI